MEDLKKYLKKCLYLFEICLYAFSAIGCTCWFFIDKNVPAIIGLFALIGMAFPEVKQAFNKLKH